MEDTSYSLQPLNSHENGKRSPCGISNESKANKNELRLAFFGKKQQLRVCCPLSTYYTSIAKTMLNRYRELLDLSPSLALRAP